MINMIRSVVDRPPFYFAQCDDYISEVSCDRSDVIISSIQDDQCDQISCWPTTPLLLCKGCPMMIKHLRGGIYHTSTVARMITSWWCCCVLKLLCIFEVPPREHQLMCCGDDQLPLWRHTSPLNCDDRCDNGWLLVQSYQAIWWCLDVLIMSCSDVMWWWCVDDQTPPRKHKSHFSCDRNKQLLSSFFQSWFETFSLSLN